MTYGKFITIFSKLECQEVSILPEIKLRSNRILLPISEQGSLGGEHTLGEEIDCYPKSGEVKYLLVVPKLTLIFFS